LNIEAD